MRRSAPPRQFLAAATDSAAMSSRPSYQGRGRETWNRRGRGYSSSSNRPYTDYVTGDAHFQSVRSANFSIREEGRYRYRFPNPRPPPPAYNRNQNFSQPYRQRPPFDQSQYQNRNNQTVRRSPAFNQNQSFRPRPPRLWDYRVWEHAKTTTPPDAERFVVLSYNILADYLATDHRGKLYYHIPRYMMDWEWRKQNIIFELGLWSPDLMCFQEVDRFQDLEEVLKQQGYSGIWKMRTGNAIDGCAVFWRTSRFKLLKEEFIEFNKLGLRDNVAQICVLELTNHPHTANTTVPPISSTGSNKVVICNIHVLYNPKRGEIKLGQVRLLLDKACAVSKLWDDAPVVICGDFNCTPKSPLYNFIAEQKLDLSGVDRDKLSGQASAAVHFPRPQNFSGASSPNFSMQPSNNLNHVAPTEGNKHCGSPSEIQKPDSPGKSWENLPYSSECSQPVQTIVSVDASYTKCLDEQYRSVDKALHAEELQETQQDVLESGKDCADSAVLFSVDSSNRRLRMFDGQSECPVNQVNDEIYKPTPTSEPTSDPEDVDYNGNEMKHTGKDDTLTTNNQGGCEPSHADIYRGGASSSCLSSQSIIEDGAGLSTPQEANLSSVSGRVCDEEDKKPEDIFQELNNLSLEGGTTEEDANKFLSALHGANDPFPPDIGESMRSENQTPEEFDLSASRSPSPDLEDANTEEATCNPCLWTPMEISIATGDAECTILEHPLELRSTYAEIEDTSGTRDSYGEPLATTYNRCFLGTVDYIWRSKGLHTVRVLAPIAKHAMQHTGGFPTKKWGSDHIALVSELALTKGCNL